MVKQIEVVAKDAQGQVQTFKYPPGAKLAAKPQTSYKLMVDGSEQLPLGTKIRRSANNVVVEFADGETLEFSGLCGADGSRLMDLGSVQALEAKSGTYVAAKEVESSSCSIAGEAGQSVGALGDSAGAGAGAAAAGGLNPYYLAPLALLGVAAAASGGGGGGGASASVAKPNAVNARLSALSDTGVQADNITNIDKPTIVGSGGTPGATVELRNAQGALLGTGTVNADGTWSLTPTSALPQGPNNLQVVLKDSAGNASDPTPLLLTIDQTPPAPASTPTSAPDLTTATDTGGSSSDNVTTNNRPGFAVPRPLVGETPVLLVDGRQVAATFDAVNNTLTPVDPVADGAHQITSAVMDVAGNVGTPSPALNISVDATPPAAAVVQLLGASNSGPLGGNLTNQSQPGFSGTGAPGDTITVTFPGGATQTTTVGTDGTWRVSSPAALAEGPNTLSVVATDPAGNASAPAQLTVTIDTVAPAASGVVVAESPVVNAGAASSGGGVPVAVTLPSNAAAGDTITVSIDGSTPVRYLVTAADVAALATPISVLLPTADITAAGQGPAVVTTTYTDAAGNGAAPVSSSLTIDTSTPASPSVAVSEGPVINAVEAASGGGVSVAVTLPADAAVGDVLTVSIDGSIPVSYTVTAADVAELATPINVLLPSADVAAAAQGPAVVSTTYTDASGNAAVPGGTNLTVDTTEPGAPTVAVSAGPAINATEAASGGGIPVAVLLPANAAVGDVITVAIDGSTPVSYVVTAADVAAFATPITVLIPSADIAAAGQGAAVVSTTYTDAAGNAGAPVTTNLTIDTAAPSSPSVAIPVGPDINASEAGSGVTVAVTLPSNAAVGDTITVSIDASTPVGYTVTAADVAAIATPISILIPSVDITLAGQGPAVVTTAYTDAAGNAATPVTSNLNIDTSASSSPSVAVSEGPVINAAEAASGGGVPIAVTLPTNAAVDDIITVSIDGSTPVSYTVTAADVAALSTPISVLIPSADISAAGQGPAVVTTTYTDAAGNVATPATTNLRIDTTAPSSPTVAVSEGPVINAAEASSGGGVPIAVTLPSNAAVGDVITVSIDGSTPVSYTVTAADVAAIASPISVLIPTADITAAGQGPAVVSTTYTDAAGNAAGPVTSSLSIDTTAPSPPTVAISEGPVINAAEAASGGGVPIAVTLPINAAVGDVITVGIDGSTPVSYTVTAANIAAIATPISILIPTADITAAGQGPAVVTTTYTDSVGNAAAPVTTNLTIDTAAPSVPSVAVAEGPAINAAEASGGGGVPVSVTLPINAAVGDVITVSIDGSPPVNYTVTAADIAAIATPISILIPTADITAAGQGPAVVTTTYTDAAGNAAALVTTNLTIDTAAPSAPSVAVAEGPVINAAEASSGGGVPVSVTLPVNAAVGDVITVSIDGSAPVNYTVTAANIAAIATPISILIPTADITVAGQGPAVVTTTYADAAGNAAAPVTTNLTIDTIAPTSPSIAVAEGPVISAAEASSGGGVPVAVTLPSNAAVGDVITVSIDGSAPINYTVTAANITAIATPISILIPTADITAAGQNAALVTTTYTDAAGNSAALATANLTIDTFGPVISSSSPLDNAVGVIPSDSITITYNEALTAGSGNQTITLYNFTTGAAVETFNVTTGVGSNGGSLSIVGNAVTLTLNVPTLTGTHYDIQTQAGAFNDAQGNSSNAVATNTALDFTTATPAATVSVVNLASTTYSQYLHTINPNLVNSNAIGLLPGGGFGTAYFTAIDDDAAFVSITPAFASGLNWFGTTYTDVGIGSNGYITFGHVNVTYSAVGIPGYTTGGMIAAQFDDWYSRAHTITGPTPGGNSTGADNTYFAAYQFAGSGVVTLTYDDVGYYAASAPGATDGLTSNNYSRGNAEQIRLVGTADGQTVIQLVYESVNWVNGNTGFPTAGWTKGDGATYGVVDGNIPGASSGGVSGTVNFLDVELVSNVGIPGVYEWVIGSDGLVGTGNVPLLNTHATGSVQLAAQLNATGGAVSYAQDATHWDSRFTLVGNQVQANAGTTFAPTETEVELWVRVTDTTSGIIYPKVVTVELFDQIGGTGSDQIGIRTAADITKLTNAVANQVVMNGGAGEDTLVFTGTGLNLDLTTVQNSALINIEKVDLGSGNTMTISLADLFAMSSPNQFNSGNGWVGLPPSVTNEQVVVDGNASDTVNILNSGTNAGFWTTTTAGTVIHAGQSYAIYNSTANTGQLLIDTDVIVAFT
jgi:hypothetical protein